MEFELIERLADEDWDSDNRALHEPRLLQERITVGAEDYPEPDDRALHIPEEELCLRAH
jgi:hypothetical protein